MLRQRQGIQAVAIHQYLCYLYYDHANMRTLTGIILSAVLFVFFCFSTSGCQSQSNKNPYYKILKIGTIHRAKSKNILFDNALTLFSLISHPPLLKLEQNGKFSGVLADDFRFSKDYTSWKFKIKKNQFWSDGKPVSPEDIRFSLLYKSKHLPNRKWLQKIIKEIEIHGDREIEFIFNKPYTRFDIELTSIRIIPRHIWKGIAIPQSMDSKISYIGCGPFVIRDVDLSSGIIRFSRNPFWKGKQPWLKEIEIHMYHSLDVLSLALERGDVDTFYKYADTFPYVHIPRFKASGQFKILVFEQNGLIFLGFNLEKKPLSDLSLRSAILHSLDYREMVKLTVNGYGKIPTAGFIPSPFSDLPPAKPLFRDISKARSILDKAGYRDLNQDGKREDTRGNPLNLKLVTTSLYIRLGELIKEYLEQIGISVRLQILDPVTWTNVKDNYNYDLTITRTSPWGMKMHAGWGSGYFDYRRSGEGVLHIIEDPGYIQLCDAILSTKDPSRLKFYCLKMQQYYSNQIPAIALIWKMDVIPIKLTISGLNYDPLFGIYNLDSFLNLKLNHANP